ncbi:MAG: hypothetical protein ABWZ88_19560 [Variovorax sp.]
MHPLQPRLGRLLVFACVVELATGLALLAAPALVVSVLLGSAPTDAGLPLARCFGIALIALAIACWPTRRGAAKAPSTWNAMLTYNVLIALFLTYLGAVDGLRGLLLWPAVVLHGAVALMLVRLRASD